MLAAGCAGLADSRLPALARLAAHALAPLTLIRAPQAHEVREAAQVADRVALCDVGTARALGEHSVRPPVGAPAHGGPRRPPRGRAAGAGAQVASELADLPGAALQRHQRQLRLPVRPAPQSSALSPSRGCARRGRRSLCRRAAALARRHVLPAAPRGLPAALPHRDPCRRRAAVRIRLRLRRRAHRPRAPRPSAHRHRTGVVHQAAGSGGHGRPGRLRPRAGRVPARREKRGTRCSPWAVATPSPRASGRCSPASPSPA